MIQMIFMVDFFIIHVVNGIAWQGESQAAGASVSSPVQGRKGFEGVLTPRHVLPDDKLIS